MKALNQSLTPKSALLYTGAILLATLLLWGGWRAYAKFTNRPPTTAQVKRSIWKFLEKQTGDSDFETPMAKAPVTNAVEVVAFTNKSGKVKTNERTKRGAFGLPETSLSVYFRTNQANAQTYEQMFRLIGQQLTVTEELLEDDDITRKRLGLVMASEASSYAKDSAVNLWLAARICEAYLWPNVSLVESTNKMPFTPDTLLTICDNAFQEAEETNNIIRNYEYLIAKTSQPQQADRARLRLARLYADIGQEKKAVATLKEIKTFKNAKVEQQIAALEQRIKNKR